MKKIIILAILTVLPLTASFAQGKLIESSNETKPHWVKREVSNHNVMKVSATSDMDLEQAKVQAYAKMKDIASRCITKYLVDMSVGGYDLEAIKEQVEDSDYIRNIDEASAIDYYWEHRIVKNRHKYTYYLLYEFNEFEKKKVALEFNISNSDIVNDFENYFNL